MKTRPTGLPPSFLRMALLLMWENAFYVYFILEDTDEEREAFHSSGQAHFAPFLSLEMEYT